MRKRYPSQRVNFRTMTNAGSKSQAAYRGLRHVSGHYACANIEQLAHAKIRQKQQ